MEPILTATAYIHTRLGRTAYMASGSIGPPLLFVHGNSCCKEAFAKQFDNSALRRHRLLAVDLPGHGNSDDVSDCPADATLANFARWLQQLIQDLGLGRPVVVGWSLGGHIAIEGLGQGMALAGLVLCGTPPVGPGAGEMEEAFMPSPEMAMTGKAAFTEAEAIRYCDSLYGGADLQNTGLAKAVRRAQGAVRESLLENYQQPGACHSQRAVVADNACPIAVIQGGADAFVNSAYFETLQWRNLWRDRVQFIETAGHAPFFERPEAFNATLLEFLGDLGYRA